MYITILMVIHILGAIAGIGPTFAFGLLGNLAGKEPSGAVHVLGAMLEIDKKLVTPVALFTQPVSGVLLIFATNRDAGFFQREWLWIAILAFATILVLVYAVNNPALDRVVKGLKDGSAGTPEWNKDLKTAKSLGPVLGILTVLIIVMMVWKPGDGLA